MIELGIFPVNLYQWLLGAITMGVFSYKTYRNWTSTGNRLSHLYFYFGTLITFALTAYFISGFAIPDFRRAHQLILLGDTLLYAGLIVHGRILAMLLFKNSLKLFGLITAAILMIATTNIYISLFNGYIIVMDGFLMYNTPYLVPFLRGVTIGLLFLPLGWLFIANARKKIGLQSTVKSSMVGLVYLGVGLGTMHRDIVLGGLELAPYVISNSMFFSALLVSMLFIRPRKDAEILHT